MKCTNYINQKKEYVIYCSSTKYNDFTMNKVCTIPTSLSWWNKVRIATNEACELLFCPITHNIKAGTEIGDRQNSTNKIRLGFVIKDVAH